MQCKDIPDLPVLKFLDDLPMLDFSKLMGIANFTGKQRGTWFWDENCKPDASVMRAMPEGTPEKLCLAKMRMLLRRGLVDGCGCGCRGDFELTPSRQSVASE